MDSIIKVSSDAFPGPKDSHEISTFIESNGTWISSTLNAEPGINGNDALHTAAVYTNSFVGNLTVQATLDNQVSDATNWADVSTLVFDGNEAEPTPINFNGVFSYIRFVADANPANKITKILVRN